MFYLVQHSRELESGEEEFKVIGVFSTRDLAAGAVADCERLAGFRDGAGTFYVSEIPAGKDHW